MGSLDGIPQLLADAPASSQVSTLPHASNMAAESQQERADPEHMLRDILAAVTSCSKSITDLTREVKDMKVELSLIRHDMQKLRERTSALKGRLSTLEDEYQPLLRDVRYVQCVASPMHLGWRTWKTACIGIICGQWASLNRRRAKM